MPHVIFMNNYRIHLNLDHFIEKFNAEKITPDKVGKISLNKFKELGIQNRANIMALCLECTKYGSEKPLSKLENQCGAPQFDIPCSVLECYIEQNLKISEISKILSISESTIYCRMKQYGLSKIEFSEISDNDLDNHVKDITWEIPHCGKGRIKQMLFVRNIKVQRWCLRDSLHRVDSEGIAQRSRGRLQRRTYHVQGPNHLWHIDTNHKLVCWNLVIIGVIGCFSRLIVMLHCSG